MSEVFTTPCPHCQHDVEITPALASKAMNKARTIPDAEEMARRGRLGAAKRWGKKQEEESDPVREHYDDLIQGRMTRSEYFSSKIDKDK